MKTKRSLHIVALSIVLLLAGFLTFVAGHLAYWATKSASFGWLMAIFTVVVFAWPFVAAKKADQDDETFYERFK